MGCGPERPGWILAAGGDTGARRSLRDYVDHKPDWIGAVRGREPKMMEMPEVSDCQVEMCAYNTDGKCHAMAITIGDTVHPKCDTYVETGTKGGDLDSIAGVGACKVCSCVHNMGLECQATTISVGYQQGEVDCLTFCAA